jgi:hypothetical protein
MRQKVSARPVVPALVFVSMIAMARVAGASPDTVLVINSEDNGPGSFRSAILLANGDPTISRVQFVGNLSTIFLTQKVEFAGAQDLSIIGNGATLDASVAGGDPAFVASGSGNLAVSSLTVRNSLAEGIVVQVPPSATGTVHVSLVNVDIVNNLGHGVLVNDQEDPSTTDGVQPDPDGSAATVDVSVINCRFIHNGHSVSDRDGLRVNEGGAGDLIITVKHTLAEENGADGIEVDERGAGDVRVDMLATRLIANGPFDPSDLDDGFDIDEYNDGSILGTIMLSVADHNREEGFDFNENNAGDLRVDMQLVQAIGNGEEGIDLEEDDDFGEDGDPNGGGGDLVTVMSDIVTIGNGNSADGALKIREKETGNLDVALMNILSVNNFGSGIFARESQTGSSVVTIQRALVSGNKISDLGEGEFGGGHGIELLESGGGNLAGSVKNSNSAANEAFGVFADETGAGVGAVTLTNVTFVGAPNGAGNTGGNAIVP